MENVKINKLEISNTMIIEAVQFELTKEGLFILGGKNKQGKTSVLHAIMWALGGDKYKPSKAHREGTKKNPEIKITLDNGLIVERKGKNSALKVTDPKGMSGGQKLLDSFIGQLALDLPKFINSTDIEKAKMMLDNLGIGDKLAEFNNQEKEIMNDRKYIKKQADEKTKQLKGMTFYADTPYEIKTMDSLLKKQDDIMSKNAKTLDEQEKLAMYENDIENEKEKNCYIDSDIEGIDSRIKELTKQKEDLNTAKRNRKTNINGIIKLAKAQRENNSKLEIISLEPVKKEMQEIESINNKVRENQRYNESKKASETASQEVTKLTSDLESVRADKKALLDNAKLPLEGLSIQDSALIYNGDKWDCMASSDQLKVSVAIVRALYPKCGFVLMDKLEQFDKEQLAVFGEWLVEQNLQVIGTRVATGDECSIIIQDGKIKE